MIMGNFTFIDAFYSNLSIESGFILKEKMNIQVYTNYSKRDFIYFITKGSQRKSLCSNSEDKIFEKRNFVKHAFQGHTKHVNGELFY